MPNTYFQFKEFLINQKKSGMKVTTDACLFGAWIADHEMDNSAQIVLDIGTGTGLLSLILAQKLTARIESVEINKEAYHEALENVVESNWSDRIKLHYSSIQGFASDKTFDLIISNPPFFAHNQIGKSEIKNQTIHADSLSMKDLSVAINIHLAETGKAWILFPEKEMKSFVEAMKAHALFLSDWVKVRNHPESKVIRVMACFGRFNREISQKSISIYKNKRLYSDEFIQLLKEYYLHLGADQNQGKT